jgi:NitT/TauT family transport system ATP-binding protein
MAVNSHLRPKPGFTDQASVADAPPSCIVLDHVSLRFRGERGEVQALSDISLSVEEGEFVALLGPTGCGKSSLLRLVSDLIPPTSGVIEVRGGPASAARRVNQFGFVFQEPAQLSWRTAIGNVRLPLEVVGYRPEERDAASSCWSQSGFSSSRTPIRTSCRAA